MKKINIKTILTTSENKIIHDVICAFYESKNKYIYYEPTEEKTKVILDLNNNELIRENSDMYMKYNFDLKNETNNILFIKSINKEINIKIKTKNINSINNIKIEYYIEKDLFIYEIIK